MDAKQAHSADYPEAIIFEERDGIFWLSGRDLHRFEGALGIRYGCIAVGFDAVEAAAHRVVLARLGQRVGLRRGLTVAILPHPTPVKAKKRVTRRIFLSPEVLIDRVALTRLATSLNRRGCKFKGCYERWRSTLTKENRTEPLVFVVKLADDMYEVDWRLTHLSEDSLHGLALAARDLHAQIACNLIVRPQRLVAKPHDSQPEVYGQLRLGL